MSEIGMSMEPPKKGLVEGLRKSFTVGGAKEQWYRDHAELVKKYADVNNGLSDEQRQQVMAKIDADATKSAWINVGTKWGATALGAGLLTGGGFLVGSEKFQDALMKKGGKWAKVGEWGAARGMQLNDLKAQSMVRGEQALTFLKGIPDRAKAWAGKFKKPATVAA